MNPSLAPWIIIIGAILLAGVVDYFIRTAPFVAAEYKPAARWVLLLLLVIFVITRLWPLVARL